MVEKVASMVQFAQQTRRLRLQPYDETALPGLFRFMHDPVAMQFTYVASTMEECGARLARHEAQRARLGFAPWCIFLKGADEPMGWGGLTIDPDQPQWGMEVVYAFAPAAWGRGYATELVSYSVEFAFRVLGEARVSAFAMPGNAASTRVLEKCGFSSLGHVPALERVHHVATRA